MDTPRITISHPGMSRLWFDRAVHRAHVHGLTATSLDADRWSVTSASDAKVRYVVTRERCGCAAGVAYGRCMHRGLVVFLEWIGQPAVALPHSDEAA